MCPCTRVPVSRQLAASPGRTSYRHVQVIVVSMTRCCGSSESTTSGAGCVVSAVPDHVIAPFRRTCAALHWEGLRLRRVSGLLRQEGRWPAAAGNHVVGHRACPDGHERPHMGAVLAVHAEQGRLRAPAGGGPCAGAGCRPLCQWAGLASLAPHLLCKASSQSAHDTNMHLRASAQLGFTALVPVQVWLQDFAWAEADKADKLRQRTNHAVGPAERQLLAGSPVFCVETALCLYRWAQLSYLGALASRAVGPCWTSYVPFSLTSAACRAIPFSACSRAGPCSGCNKACDGKVLGWCACTCATACWAM